jgi:hypothetical protein
MFVLNWLGFLKVASHAQQSYRTVFRFKVSAARAILDTKNKSEGHGFSSETKIEGGAQGFKDLALALHLLYSMTFSKTIEVNQIDPVANDAFPLARARDHKRHSGAKWMYHRRPIPIADIMTACTAGSSVLAHGLRESFLSTGTNMFIPSSATAPEKWAQPA